MSLTKRKRQERATAPCPSPEPQLKSQTHEVITPLKIHSITTYPGHSPEGQAPGSLSLRRAPGGTSAIITTSSGREIWIDAERPDLAMATLMKLLDVEYRKQHGGQFLTLSNQSNGPISNPGVKTAKYTVRGKRQLTLEELGL